MHDESLHQSPIEHPERHEPTDIETRALTRAALVFLMAGLVIPLALFLVLRYYERTATRANEDRVQSEVRQTAPNPPEPRLQGVPTFHGPLPKADMEKLRKESEQRLATYGKSDDPNFVRIPIDRAMQILAERQMKPTTQKAP